MFWQPRLDVGVKVEVSQPDSGKPVGPMPGFLGNVMNVRSESGDVRPDQFAKSLDIKRSPSMEALRETAGSLVPSKAAAQDPPPAKKPRRRKLSREEMEVPDDGFRWLQYGKKPLIDTRYSRFYYKCASKKDGCPAKKTVDCCHGDSSFMRVSYEGRHSHPAPSQAPREVYIYRTARPPIPPSPGKSSSSASATSAAAAAASAAAAAVGARTCYIEGAFPGNTAWGVEAAESPWTGGAGSEVLAETNSSAGGAGGAHAAAPAAAMPAGLSPAAVPMSSSSHGTSAAAAAASAHMGMQPMQAFMMPSNFGDMRSQPAQGQGQGQGQVQLAGGLHAHHQQHHQHEAASATAFADQLLNVPGDGCGSGGGSNGSWSYAPPATASAPRRAEEEEQAAGVIDYESPQMHHLPSVSSSGLGSGSAPPPTPGGATAAVAVAGGAGAHGQQGHPSPTPMYQSHMHTHAYGHGHGHSHAAAGMDGQDSLHHAAAVGGSFVGGHAAMGDGAVAGLSLEDSLQGAGHMDLGADAGAATHGTGAPGGGTGDGGGGDFFADFGGGHDLSVADFMATSDFGGGHHGGGGGGFGMCDTYGGGGGAGGGGSDFFTGSFAGFDACEGSDMLEFDQHHGLLGHEDFQPFAQLQSPLDPFWRGFHH
eukprot:jgi/Mesen1/9434/ME000618S08819